MPNIVNIKPRGFCCGVSSAVFQAISAAKKYKGQKVYMIENVIHNKYLNDKFKKLGIEILNFSNLSRKSIIEKYVQNNSVVIFSAHGTPNNAYMVAKSKNCKIIDTTCIYVKQTHEIIKKYLALNYIVFFIGVKGHPETDAILDINPNIELLVDNVDVKALSSKYKKNEKILVVNQTTISKYEYGHIINNLKKIYSNLVVKDEICNATKVRQEAVYNINPKINDLILVIGDRTSNNSNKLVEIGNNNKSTSLLIENISDIKKIDLKKYENIYITAGASTPDDLISIIYDYVKNNS